MAVTMADDRAVASAAPAGLAPQVLAKRKIERNVLRYILTPAPEGAVPPATPPRAADHLSSIKRQSPIALLVEARSFVI